jgi:hypothetical protein
VTSINPDDPLPLIDPQFEEWFRSDEMQFVVSSVIMAAMLWHVQHRHDWQDPDDDETYEALLHSSVELFNHELEKFRANGH